MEFLIGAQMAVFVTKKWVKLYWKNSAIFKLFNEGYNGI